MGNKFLDLYPKLWIPKVGDKIVITAVLDEYKQPAKNPTEYFYSIGDTGHIIKIADDLCEQGELIYVIKLKNVSEAIFREEMDLYHEK